MRINCEVVDADCHVMEPRDLWLNYMDVRWRSRAPQPDKNELGREWAQLMVDGIPMYRKYPDTLVEAFHRRTVEEYGDFLKNDFDAHSHLRAMDVQSIDISFLYPSLALGAAAIDGQDASLSTAIVRAYNNWLFDFCVVDRHRLRPVALISLHDCEHAIAELNRVVYDLGIKAVVIRPNMVNGRPVGHTDFEPFWARSEALDVSISFHEGCHTRLPAAGADRFETHFAMHAACHPIEQMMAFISMIEGAVFEDHPGLRVSFLESGCGWVPYLLWRLDDLEFKYWGFQVPDVKKRAVDYFRTQCWVSVEGSEPYLTRVIEEIGSDRLLFASDFPHPDHGFGEEITEILSVGLSEDVIERILSHNAREFYGMR